METALLRFVVAAALAAAPATGVAAEPDVVWSRTLEAAGTWQQDLGEAGFWCRDDARTGLADQRETAARECRHGPGRQVRTGPVEEEIEEGAQCRARQQVVCAGAARF